VYQSSDLTGVNAEILKNIGKFILASIIASHLSACAVTKVDAVVPTRKIATLCIDHNPDAGPNYDAEIGAYLDKMGIKNRMTGGAFPGECPHRLQTRVQWSNSLIKYVVAMELVITEEQRTLGDASYSVGQAYRTPERLGSAASKAKPMLEELFADYNKKMAQNQEKTEENAQESE